MYETSMRLRRQLRIRYPAGEGRIALRTELDWDRDLEPVLVEDGGDASTFTLEARKPFLYFKPCLVAGDGSVRWSVGPDMLLLMTSDSVPDVYPYFEGEYAGSFTPQVEIESKILGRTQRLRVYLPPGYQQNPLRRFPVVYMQDGKNLFFPGDAFLGRDWQVDEALSLLDEMNAVDRVVVVGIYSDDRMRDYTKPGYEAYARSVVEEIKPEVDRRFRVFDSARETGVFGSSLGGVVSFYMAFQYPQVFGFAACLSSTFSHRDDLIERVLQEPKSAAKFYLDSGWPGDNYEVTQSMAMAFHQRGYKLREDFVHLAFPLDEHDERAWGRRLHLPLQLALGRTSTAQRGRFV
jgi:predicted alpha/beta superfamily hydrolase